MPRVHLIIHGTVQGVGFRYFARREAQARGVSGWARNCPDGTVEIEAEAGADALSGFIEAMRHGPRFALVTRLEQADIPETGGGGAFGIRF